MVDEWLARKMGLTGLSELKKRLVEMEMPFELGFNEDRTKIGTGERPFVTSAEAC